MPIPFQPIASMVQDLKSSMVKLFKKVAELADQQSGQTGPIALLHAPVALSDNNSDSQLNQKHNHKLAQLPLIHAVSVFSKIFENFRMFSEGNIIFSRMG